MTKDPMKRERDYYDTHELDYSTMRRTELRRIPGAGQPRSTFAVRLDGEVIEQLRQIAERHGIGPTQLVRQWIIDRIANEDTMANPRGKAPWSEQSDDRLKESLRPLVRELLSEELGSKPKLHTTESK